jgi:hypothetical protein
MVTGLEAFPVIMNPAIMTLSPVSTRSRVEMLSAWAELTAGVGVGVAVAVGVAVGVALGVAVGVAVGVVVGVGVGAGSLSTIVTVVVCGVPTAAPATALRAAVKVSFPSEAESSRIVITTSLLVSPGAKVTSPEAPV